MPTSIPPAALALIKQFEGFAATKYLCPAGKPTIGYGHVISKGEFAEGARITEAEADALLQRDLEKYARAAQKLLKRELTDAQWAAVLSFVYNVGVGNFARSTLLTRLNAGEWQAAADEFPRWVYAGGKKLAGLERRRAAEREMFLNSLPESVL